MSTINNALRSFALAAAIALAPGCAAGVDADSTAPSAVDGYQPVTNESGNVVYYDTVGEPYYYEGNRVVYVVHTSPRYAYYVGHYRTYRPYYSRWYAHHGYRYRYRRYYRR